MRESALRLRIEEVDRRLLVEDEGLLESIYAVLAVAHYRNSPNDLQLIIEAPGHRLLVAFVDDAVGGALDAVLEPREGSRGRGVIPDVFVRMGWGDPGPGYRVVRIAVAPCIQRRGVGSAMLRELERIAASEGVEWVGASFGHYEPLAFWLRNGYIPVHVSPRFNPATGEKNIVVIKPLGEKAARLVGVASCSLLRRLVYSGSSVFRDMPAEIVALLLKGIPSGCEAPNLSSEQLGRLQLFLHGKLAYESVHDVLLLGLHILHSMGAYHELSEKEIVLLVLLVVQGKPIYEAERLLGLARGEAEDILRRVYSLLAQPSGDRLNPV
ncbi:GCN5-related N-acetyltransferase [Pyrolobus fumarii 1A]|uniref:GCN5-related N-acetyltransferase n=1 Tax=Pyrolobus fumarii (strain DSM 11204 / 1A) TaxID=694429 RepID=G0EDF6_PYRF1|nr:GNAT family N-acetyltransferase [Pyrolobus fumarii]AEM38641.1 GCN5-related N-acetyltransferase [Pyrolobus fumarii 1A]